MADAVTFQMAWQVRFVDTDASGFVHFSSYVRMMEETEYAFLRSRNLSVVLRDSRGVMGFPRLSADVKVIDPLRFGQTAEIRLSLISLDGKQIIYEFVIVDEENRLVATGRFAVACCRFPDDGSPFAVLIPENVMKALA